MQLLLLAVKVQSLRASLFEAIGRMPAAMKLISWNDNTNRPIIACANAPNLPSQGTNESVPPNLEHVKDIRQDIYRSHSMG